MNRHSEYHNQFKIKSLSPEALKTIKNRFFCLEPICQKLVDVKVNMEENNKKYFVLLRSPFVHKKSKETFCFNSLQTYVNVESLTKSILIQSSRRLTSSRPFMESYFCLGLLKKLHFLSKNKFKNFTSLIGTLQKNTFA